jgi:putative transposase
MSARKCSDEAKKVVASPYELSIIKAMKAYKFKLRRNKKFVEQATRTLDVCRELYNASLEERRNAHHFNQSITAKTSIQKASVNYYSQKKQLPLIKKDRPDLNEVHSQVLQDVIARVDKAYQGYFDRVAAGQKPGYPRFKGPTRYNSFTYTQSGFDLKGDKLSLSKIGTVRLRLSRRIEGKVKTCTIAREADGWYVVFTVDTKPFQRPLPKTGETVGADVGIEAFATLSTGQRIANKRFTRQSERELKTAHRRLSRRKKFGKNWRKANKNLSRKYKKVQRQRRDFHFKQANKLVARFDVIKFEDLKVKKMVKNHHLAKAIEDVGWAQFIAITAFKAEEAGKQVLVVNPNGTSQICSQCKQRVPKSLADRWHECPDCGFSTHRDHNSALEIKERSGRPFVEPEGSKRRRNPLQRKKQEPLAKAKTNRHRAIVAA